MALSGGVMAVSAPFGKGFGSAPPLEEYHGIVDQDGLRFGGEAICLQVSIALFRRHHVAVKEQIFSMMRCMKNVY
jgi:hypothetical protein